MTNIITKAKELLSFCNGNGQFTYHPGEPTEVEVIVVADPAIPTKEWYVGIMDKSFTLIETLTIHQAWMRFCK